MNLRRSFLSAAAAAAVFLPILSRTAASEPTPPNPKIMIVTPPDQINWRKSANADTAIVQGDPTKPGIYIELIRWHAGNMSRPHTHGTERYIYVISGTWWVGQGPKYDPASTYPVKEGSYVVHKANEIHYDGAKDADCVLEIVGTGPLTTTPAEQK